MHPVSGGYHWSQESVAFMQKFVRYNFLHNLKSLKENIRKHLSHSHLYFSDDLRKCLRNKPNVGKPYKKILPGRVMSRDEQCKKLTGFEAYTVISFKFILSFLSLRASSS